MIDENFVFTYLKACGTGQLALAECGPVWQMGIIGLLLASAIAALLVLRLSNYARSAQS